MKNTVHMVFEGTIAENIVKLELTIYRKYVWNNKKVKLILYVQLKKSAVRDTSGSFSDHFVANRMINGKQGALICT